MPNGPRSDENHVARSNLEVGFPFPGVQIPRVDGCAGLQIIHALQSRDIHQDAEGDNAILVVEDAVFAGALVRHFFG